MFSQLFATAVIAVSVQSVIAATSCSRSYTIQTGDYCDKISQAQNVSTYQLAVSNLGKYKSDCTDLRIGGELCLATSPEEDCKTTYTVVSGDTCDGVASSHGLNTTILYLNNPQINEVCSNIYVGEVLCVSNSVQVAAIPSGGVTVPAPGASSTVLSSTIAHATGAATLSAVPAATTTFLATPTGTSGQDNNSGSDNDETCDDDDSDDNNNSGDNEDDCDDDDASGDNDDDDDLPFCDELDD